MAKKVLRLDLPVDYALWGIVTPLRMYRLVYFLNKVTSLDFERYSDHQVRLAKDQVEIRYDRYYCPIALDRLHYYLMANYSATHKKPLVPEYQRIDFWLMVKGDAATMQAEKHIHAIENLSQVQTIVPVDPVQLSSKHNLTFDDEDLYTD